MQYKYSSSLTAADGFTFRTGVTTVVDAGCTGWRDFELYKKRTIDTSQTRVLAMLNIVGTGMDGAGENNIDEMDPQKTSWDYLWLPECRLKRLLLQVPGIRLRQ